MTESKSICECQHAEELHSHIDGRCLECWREQRKILCYEFRPIPPGFKPIITAPKNAKWVTLYTEGQEYIRAHWAEDLSGSDQPPFRGWYYDRGGFFDQVRGKPVAWAPEMEKHG